MITEIIVLADHEPEELGFIPAFLDVDDPRPADKTGKFVGWL
jgi:hypothetical protein